MLLSAYGKCDGRVLRLGALVKSWAKSNDLVGTADGHLNSYAYVLLVIHYLQCTSPPVVPNLQRLGTRSAPVADTKWGSGDCWETKFLEDVGSLPPSENGKTLAELLAGFFRFYGREVFDWERHAVCIRLNRPGKAVDKFSLVQPLSDQAMWYVEDPFDLKHNLAAQCSPEGRRRILRGLWQASVSLDAGKWLAVCPGGSGGPPSQPLLRLRLTRGVTARVVAMEFEDFGLTRLYFPRPSASAGQRHAFLEFPSSAERSRAHTRNEVCFAGDCQLLLVQASRHALAEALATSLYEVYEPLGDV